MECVVSGLVVDYTLGRCLVGDGEVMWWAVVDQKEGISGTVRPNLRTTNTTQWKGSEMNREEHALTE